MRIISSFDTCNKYFEGSVVTIGNFDGVHKGHVEIFMHLKERSRKLGLPSVVVTFEPHPLKVLAPGKAPSLITTFEQKSGLISAAGIDCLVVVPFTTDFSRTTAEDFVRFTLCDALGMRHIVIGHDYAFGKDRQGNFQTIQKIAIERGFTFEDMNPIGENDVIFSSSLVRKLVSSGDVRAASEILGRYHVISGSVVHGREIGHSLGFPTANISSNNELIPKDGVYAVLASIEGQSVKGACNIGMNPTFEGGKHTIEVFLLDFNAQVYGCDIEICFVDRLRDVKKFLDISGLIDAIEYDVGKTRIILENINMQLVQIPLPIGIS